ncbi:oxidoreductase [Streptosporangiaceae bacterium NEAU-GS5]|nr:oxidoreductase [Streptosporangiaceae bacterium NEAU-GS5]
MSENGLLLRVCDTRRIGPGVKQLTMVRQDGVRLPSFPPGSHLVVACGADTGRRNAYSLTNAGLDPDSYTISVLRRPTGSGGSAWLHGLRAGDTVLAWAPRSAFPPVAGARRHLYVAGGIGITPLLAHVREALRLGRDFALVYATSDGPDGPHVEELSRMCGARLRIVRRRHQLMAELAHRLGSQPMGTHLYTCGPEPMMEAVLDAARAGGWPEQRLHFERFDAALTAGAPFTVRLRRSGRCVEVPKDTSMLDALLNDGSHTSYLCRNGVCGECRLHLVSGEPEHRDFYLTDAERADGAFMPCVSRGRTTLEVDL